MKLKTDKLHKGFTLVEIMIVVAIIALLAAIAVPNFLRARQRSQATRVLNEFRLIEDAIALYQAEYNTKKDATIGPDGFRKYIKPGTPLYNRISDTQILDALNNPVIWKSGFRGISIHDNTYLEFKGVVDDAFWGPFIPDSIP